MRNGAVSTMIETIRAKWLEDELDSQFDPMETMISIWRTTNTWELRAAILASEKLRFDVRNRCLKELDLFDVRRALNALPKDGSPYRIS